MAWGLAEAVGIDDGILGEAASRAMNAVWKGNSEAFNNGQLILAEYIIPAMEEAIWADPEGFDPSDVAEAGYAAHWAAEQALSDTIESSADAAGDARDGVQNALDVAGIVL